MNTQEMFNFFKIQEVYCHVHSYTSTTWSEMYPRVTNYKAL